MSKKTENQLRRVLQREGYILHKSRVKDPTYHNMGGYMIVIAAINGVAAGSRFELSLDDVREFVEDFIL